MIPHFLNRLPALHILLADGLFLCAIITAAKLLRRVTAIYLLFVLPGTCAHEIAHFLVAAATNGRPRFPSIIPARTRAGWLLGSVQLGNARWYNTAAIAFAPLLLLPLSMWFYWHRISAMPLLRVRHWLSLYAIIVVSMSALPSSVDLRLAWKNSAGLVFIASAGLIGYALLHYVLPKHAMVW